MTGNELKIKLKKYNIELAEIARSMGVSPQNLQSKLNSDDLKLSFIEEIAKSINKSVYDLIEGGNSAMVRGPQIPYGSKRLFKKENSSGLGLPLIPIDAMAGFGNGDIQVSENEVTDYYEVPLFEKRGAKYLISVAGNSMYPKYASGDLLACKPLKDLSFVQWGKPYVLDTEQGAIVKRLFENPEKKDVLICKSDNSEFYPPFNLPVSAIYKVAIVVGVIRLE